MQKITISIEKINNNPNLDISQRLAKLKNKYKDKYSEDDLKSLAIASIKQEYELFANNRINFTKEADDLLEKIKDTLEQGKPARSLDFTDEEIGLLKETFLLTMKPILYIANISEHQIENIEDDKYVKQVIEYAEQENAEVVPLCVKIEEELASLEGQDKQEMMEALGIKESGLDRVIQKSYNLLGLMSFLTAGEPEVRAWTIKKGTKAPQAAGKIHTDIERGFIRAEVVSYDDLIKEGSMSNAKEKGLVRSEGKEYIMQEGDIVLFRFNV